MSVFVASNMNLSPFLADITTVADCSLALG